MSTPQEPLRLLSVHAHPDDESSKGAGTVARYSDEGVRCVLVCCTGGEAGDILNPAMDTPEVRADITGTRRRELEAAADHLGYAEVVMLGYRDSGMPGMPENEDPRCFARAGEQDVVGRLVAILRRERPHVVLSYPDIQDGYAHPDHLRVQTATVTAVREAADPKLHPWAGPVWDVAKLYYSMWSRSRIVATHEKMVELGLESPYESGWLRRPSQDFRITTRLDVTGQYARKKAALLSHATQIDPASPFWFALPDDVAEAVHPWEEYTLVRSLVEVELPEDDLFAGVRDQVPAADAVAVG